MHPPQSQCVILTASKLAAVSNAVYICRIFWESNKFEGKTDKIEPWYNTPYSLEKITKETIQVGF